MKNLVLFVCSLMLVLSCSKESNQNETAYDFVQVGIPSAYKAKEITVTNKEYSEPVDVEVIDVEVIDKNGERFNGQMRITIPAGDENSLVNFEMSGNIFDKTDLEPGFWSNSSVNSKQVTELQAKLGCISDCQKEFTDDNGVKVKGRGLCKAGCWAETAAKVAGAIAAILLATK